MVIKKFFLILLLLLILFTLTGCYNSTGIDRQYFVISLGLDLTSDGFLKIIELWSVHKLISRYLEILTEAMSNKIKHI